MYVLSTKCAKYIGEKLAIINLPPPDEGNVNDVDNLSTEVAGAYPILDSQDHKIDEITNPR